MTRSPFFPSNPWNSWRPMRRKCSNILQGSSKNEMTSQRLVTLTRVLLLKYTVLQVNYPSIQLHNEVKSGSVVWWTIFPIPELVVWILTVLSKLCPLDRNLLSVTHFVLNVVSYMNIYSYVEFLSNSTCTCKMIR